MNKPAFYLLAISIIVLTNGTGYAQAKESCLKYEPYEASVTGVYYEKTFPGPPNYASVAKGDMAVIYWILILEKPICVESDEKTYWEAPFYNVMKLHLVVKKEMYKRYANLKSKEVIVKGSLMQGHTAHHETAVLMIVTDIKEVNGN